jgi:hypothetical protein
VRRSRHPRTSRLGRSIRGRLFDRNPLRRGTDRLETAILVGLFVVVCATAPFLAVAASDWENSISLREMRVQQATFHEVRATLLDDARSTDAYRVSASEADVSWTAPSGRTVTDVMPVPSGAQAGSAIWLWTNQSGHVISPLLPNAIPAREGLAAEAAVASQAAVAFLVGLVVRGTLNRRRLTAWANDWLATEPRWNTRR